MKSAQLVLTVALLSVSCGGSEKSAVPTTTVVATTTTPVTSDATTTTAAPANTATTTTTPTTSTVAAASTDPALDQAFAAAVREYIATNWAGWADGVILGECLATNASDIDGPAKQGVIDFGLDDVFDHISQTDGFNLNTVWNDCETLATATPTTSSAAPDNTATTTTTPTTSTVAAASTDPALDQAFAAAVREYIATNWAGWADGVILGECLAANASDIDGPAKQGVIDFGLDEVFDHISQTDGSSLNTVWDNCETVVASSKAELATAATENRPAATENRPAALTFVPSTAYASFPAGTETAFRDAVDAEFSAAPKKAGISVAVFNDEMLWTYASGIASSTAEMTTNTPSRIWSASKIFISPLILNQIEQGLFELGDSLESVLSGHPDYPSIDPAIYNPAVTVEEMLRMRAGTAPRNFENPPEGAYSIYSNPDWKPVDVLGLLEDPWVEPGSFSYSNLNSVLLGLVAEHHGGQDLNALYRDTLFEPLGITIGLTPRDVVPLDTARAYSEDLGLWGEHYGLDLSGFGDRIEAEIAAGWEDNPTDWHIGQGKITWAAAGAFSTAENMARWAYELFSPNGSAISESNQAMLLNSFGTELVDFEGRMQYYGYHATKSDVILEDGTVVTAYGHPGGADDWKGNYVSKLAYSPELDLSVSVLTNSPLSGKGSCPDHSADASQRFGPQQCLIQEMFKAYANSARGGESGGRNSEGAGTAQADVSEISAADRVRSRWSRQQCDGSGGRMLSQYPFAPEDINFIYPLGALTQAHITPVSHNYIYPKRDVVADVFSPVDGYVVKMSNRNATELASDSVSASTAEQGAEIHYIIEASCDFYVVLDHVTEPPEPFLSAVGDTFNAWVRIPVKAGDLLGRQHDGNKVDLSVVDLTRGETSGFVINESYHSGEYGEPYKLFEQDSFEYLTEPLLSEVEAKSLRTETPRGGTFTYDVDGTAMGNWFQEGTGGYAGDIEMVFFNYFAGHLALVPDALNPDELRISIGDGFKGESWGSHWGVTGNQPDFREVTPSTGPTAFGLQSLDACDPAYAVNPKAPEYYERCPSAEVGTLLVELLDDRTIRVEAFFGSPPEGSLTFSDAARIYVR